MTLTDLQQRVRAATGADRELDAAIYIAVVKGENPDDYRINQQFAHLITPYTASLDAALALVEAKLPGWKRKLSTERHASFLDYQAHAELMDRDWPDPNAGYGLVYGGHGATEPLALLDALCSALLAQEPVS